MKKIIYPKYLIETISTVILNNMENLTNIYVGELPKDSPYVKPFRMFYTQNGKEKNWDLLKVHDSVSIVLYNTSRNVLLFVKQFRPAVYYGVISSANENGTVDKIDVEKFPAKLGVTLELCAGIVDKSKSLIEIAQEEILEEVGYDAPLNNIEKVLTYRSGVGATGAQQTMFYCEVQDEQKSNSGGGVDDEIIEVVEYTIDEAKKLVEQGIISASPPSFLFGVLWFLTNRAHKFQKI